MSVKEIKMSRRATLQNVRGITLTELTIVMMIIGVIMGAIWVAAAAVYRNNRIATTQKQIMVIVQKARSLHGLTQGTMLDMAIQGTAGAVTMAQAGAIPIEMMDDPSNPGAVKHAWDDDVTFGALNNGVNGDSFRIGLVDIPQNVCGELLVRMTGVDRDPGILQAGTSTQMYGTSDFPLSIIEATTACPGDTETILLDFQLKS